jgi:orotidine-5'-phosphate decarboxylase
MPANTSLFDFNRAIIDATADLVCAYKLNFAFYEALGGEGFDVLKHSLDCIPEGILTIGDAKRGDIGNTARAYAAAIFNELGFDAATVSPYLGGDSIEPFLEYGDRGVFVLCRTSNPGSADFQSLRLGDNGSTLFEAVAQKAEQWNKHGNVGLVVGATCPEELRLIRQQHPALPLLIPGVGAQGGDLEKAVSYGVDACGERAIINSSRQIIYASRGAGFAAAARRAAAELRDKINLFRNKRG